MKISLNGETVDACEAKTIAELIDRYRLPPQSILVEHNGLSLHRREWRFLRYRGLDSRIIGGD